MTRTFPQHSTPFYRMVPKGPVSNLLFRREMIRRVMVDPEFAGMLRRICAADPFFYINTFVWTINPKRAARRKKVPFITYQYQDDGLDVLLDSLDELFDVQIEKSRQMGASWVISALIEWCWHFRAGQNFMMLSRSDEYVDKSDEPKSLFWKIDYIRTNLPRWLLPVGWNERDCRKVKRIVNPDNRSTIVGEATTEDSGRGGSFTAVLLDEFGACDVGMGILKSTRDATGTRWFNSTPKGTGNAHYRIVQLSRTNPKQVRPLRFHWSQHPDYGRLLYRLDSTGAPKAVEKKDAAELERYIADNQDLIAGLKKRGFWDDFKIRSPWFDTQCARSTTKTEIAQELEIDYAGSGYQFFEQAVIQEHVRMYACPPKLVGDVDVDLETFEVTRFREHGQGRLSLWCDMDKSPPIGRPYVIGVDASAGTGASNSVASIWDARTGEKVGELVDPNCKPERFAKIVVALCRWFDVAFLIWETNGSGRAFGDEVIESGYGNFYKRAGDSETGETGGRAGWAPTRDNKYQLLSQYRGALSESVAFNRSEQALGECLEYVFMGNNWVEHTSLGDMEDPSGARDQHGDRVIADALAVKVLDDQPKTNFKLPSKSLSPLSVAGRRESSKSVAVAKRSPFVFN